MNQRDQGDESDYAASCNPAGVDNTIPQSSHTAPAGLPYPCPTDPSGSQSHSEEVAAHDEHHNARNRRMNKGDTRLSR